VKKWAYSLALLLSGCATTQSDIQTGAFDVPVITIIDVRF